MTTKASVTVRVNKPALMLVTMLATAIGITPWVLLVGRPWLLIFFSVGALLISVLAIRHFKTCATESPGFLEFLLGFVGAIATPAATSLVGVFFYGIAYWLTRLGLWIASWFGGEPRIDVSSIAFWVSLFFVAVVGLAGTVPTVQKLAKQLYPQTAGLRSALYSLAAFRGVLAFAILTGALLLFVGGLLIALLAPGVSGTWWFSLLLAWALVGMGVPLQELGKGEEVSAESESIIRAVRELFEAGGYKVVASPRTGREDIDPLLVTTPDLYAESPERGFAIEVKTAAYAAEAEDWGELSDLSSAAWALGSYLNEGSEEEPTPVEPLLVLVGLDPPPPVKIYQKKGLLRVLRIEDKKILKEFLKTEDGEKRGAMARRYLQFPEVTSTSLRPA